MSSKRDKVNVQPSYDHYVVCVDGSEASFRAFNVVIQLRKQNDYVTVLHATNHKERNLESKYRSNFIKESYQLSCMDQLPKTKFQIVVLPAATDCPPMAALTRWINAARHKAALVAIGLSGVSGLEQGGSTQDYVIRRSYSPTLVVKTKGNVPNRQQARWLICVDGSKRSESAWNAARRFFKEKDELVVMWVKRSDFREKVKRDAQDVLEKTLKARYQEWVSSCGFKGAFVVEEAKDEVGMQDFMVNRCASNEFDYIVMSQDGQGAQDKNSRFYGSTVDRVVRKSVIHSLVAPTDPFLNAYFWKDVEETALQYQRNEGVGRGIPPSQARYLKKSGWRRTEEKKSA